MKICKQNRITSHRFNRDTKLCFVFFCWVRFFALLFLMFCDLKGNNNLEEKFSIVLSIKQKYLKNCQNILFSFQFHFLFHTFFYSRFILFYLHRENFALTFCWKLGSFEMKVIPLCISSRYYIVSVEINIMNLIKRKIG